MSSPGPLGFAELVEADRTVPGMIRRGAPSVRAGAQWGRRWAFRGGRGYRVSGRASILGRLRRRGRPAGWGIDARGAPRLQREGAGGRRVGRQPPLVTEHQEPAIEQFAHLDPAQGVGLAVRCARQLHPARPEGHGVITGHPAEVPAAQELGEVAGWAAPDPGGRGGRDGEAAVEVGDERRQEGVGLGEGADTTQPQLADEAILQRLPEALDAALGLRGVGGDEADAEGLQHPAEVGGLLGARQLFGERPVAIVADEDIEAIPVEGQRQAVGGEQLVEERGGAVQVLGRAEVQGEHRAGGVIDGAEQGHGRAASLQPVEGTAIDLDDTARGGFTPPALAVGPGAAAARGGPPEGAAEPADRGPADRQAVLLAEFLGEVRIIEARVDRGQERGDLLAHGAGQPLRGGLTPAAVDQAGGPGRAVAGLGALHLPDGQAQGRGRLAIGDAVVAQGLEDAGPGSFLPTHGDGVHEGMTFSLTR